MGLTDKKDYEAESQFTLNLHNIQSNYPGSPTTSTCLQIKK